ncbi:protein SODIUM POTASSIUM ROOT DEFECTIVE 3 [Vigna radiata var. radiata]|uniref:Protein SODIUM POTASSIUM ROOT DEFECTIVE 3 n=2 Tax=Vigna radiata var. radiata TaxID=3916 RepID=A0A1S3TI22_VIGRR|nr:protein SODIUM POTASSIUM ROOT DEFECTIVE 3 [Vigna radiata var. radiata]
MSTKTMKIMKGIDLLCSSSASTAVTSSMHHRSTVRGRTKSYDHDGRKSQLCVPCSSQLPLTPKPHLEKHRKSSADKANSDTRRKSSVDVNDLYTHASAERSSRRYLLADAPFVEWVSESNKFTQMVPSRHDVEDKTMVIKRNHAPTLRSSSSARSKDQVVVLRVSLHCKACEGKIRKHISKMEGVTSFSIEMETKKVTIIGDVTPMGVLASVSKVKNAQLWPSL